MTFTLDFLDAGIDTNPQTPHFWIVTKKNFPNGYSEPFHLWFPTDTLEWRSAEYLLDKDDTNLLWDLSLAEFFMTPQDYAGEPQLYFHEDMDAITESHLGRAARIKWRHRLATRTGHKIHEYIKANSWIHPETHALKQQGVHSGRLRHVMQNQSRAHKLSLEGRTQSLRSAFGGTDGNNDR